MKISKSLLEALQSVLSQPTNQHSPKGNVIIKATTKRDLEEAKKPEPRVEQAHRNAAEQQKGYAREHQILANRHPEGSAEHKQQMRGYHVAMHQHYLHLKAAGDKVGDKIKEHKAALKEEAQIEEAVSSYATKEAAAAVANKLKEKHNDQGWGHAKKPDGRWYVTHADHSRVDIKRHIGKLMEEEELEEAKKEGGYKASLQHHELPSKVKTAVKKIHKVLEKHKVQGAHVSVAHHDYKPAHERQSAGHHEINIQVGRHHIDNERLINDLHATQPHKWTHKKGDIAISPCASIHPSPAHNIHKHLVEDVEIDAEDELIEARGYKRPKPAFHDHDAYHKFASEFASAAKKSHPKLDIRHDEHGVYSHHTGEVFAHWDHDKKHGFDLSHNLKFYKEDVEAVLDEARYSLRRGESHGRHYRDEHGVVWDDEGYNSAGTGPSDHRERAMFSHKKPAATKHYHEVPYAKKEHAKGEGMKWDSEKKKWYHTDAAKSATSKFKKLHEDASNELTEKEVQQVDEQMSKFTRDRMASNAAANKNRVPVANSTTDGHKKSEPKLGLHRVAVTVSDPNHPAVSQRKETVQKFVKVRAGGRFEAEGSARRHYQKQGYKVHDVNHHSEIKEEVEGVLTSELFTEEHATREAAQKRLEAIEKKHPLAKHSVIQGRRTGKWHVVRHTSGGMHVVEGYEPEFDELIEDCGLDSKGDWKNYKSKADKKKSDGIDDDGGGKKAKDNIKEGDESEADYQKYKKEHEEKRRKEQQAKQQRAATIKSLIRRTK